MKKELEEAINWLKSNIKYYNEQIEFIKATDCDYYDEEQSLYEKRIKIFKNILNYIDNSISKEVIEEKKAKLLKEYKEAIETNSTRAFILKCQLEFIKELLEGK